MELDLYQLDAFSDRVFGGNPAAVCPLERWLDDATMLAIAAENNLSETAFFVREGDGYHLRWFTPTTEVELCGHATLASGALILTRLEPNATEVRFRTRSGALRVTRDASGFTIDLPAKAATERTPDPALMEALGGAPIAHLAASADLVVYPSEAAVRALSPDLRALVQQDSPGVIVTAPGEHHDFVSRYFAPAKGVDEDPVTGSAHCTLVPYWAARLGKHSLRAHQASRRGGDLACTLKGDRVLVSGACTPYLEGRIQLPG